MKVGGTGRSWATRGPRAGSGRSAGASCPRPWCPRARSWSGSSAPPGPTRASAPSWTACSATTPAGPPRSPARRGCPPSSACGCCSSARTWPTPAATRSTTWSARPCWPGGSARPRWSPRPARASTGWPPPRSPRTSAWAAPCTWASGTWPARNSTCSGWSCSGRPWSPVSSGSRTLKDATSEALRHWVTTVDSTHYCIGSVLGPHPYPWLVREFQRVIGDEARAQCAARPDLLPSGRPDVVVACVGGGSNAAGTFAGFADTPARLVGVEAAGGAAVSHGRPRRAARLPVPVPAGRARPDHRGRVGLGRAGLPRRRARARPPGRHAAAPSTTR